jgi:hypothetical protein
MVSPPTWLPFELGLTSATLDLQCACGDYFLTWIRLGYFKVTRPAELLGYPLFAP